MFRTPDLKLNMGASDEKAEEWGIWLNIADIFLLNNALHLAELFPEIPPPTDLSAGSTEAEVFSSCFLESSNYLAVFVSQWAKENPHEISAEEMRAIQLRRSAINHATKCLGKERLLLLILHRVGYPNPNTNHNQQLASLQINNQQVMTPRNQAAKEARTERIFKRQQQKACRLGKGREEPKQELGFKHLMRRVLRKEDVDSLGRIALPIKAAEKHLPILESRRGDGIVLAVKDLKTSLIWNMQFRYLWNKRKYVLENTGDFVRFHRLQVGDFIELLMDREDGKYMIWPVKMPA